MAYLLLVDGGALPLRGGGALLLVFRPTGRSSRSSVVGAGRLAGAVVVTQLGEPSGHPHHSETD